MKNLQGHLLVASAELKDPNFFRSVVLLIRHNDEGAFGLILNRPTSASVKEIWTQVSETPCLSDEPLRLGGPVQGPLMAIHTVEHLSDIESVPGVFASAEPEKLEELVARAGASVRFFAGYAGWGAGQLENELGEGSWLTTPASAAHIFGDDEELWQRVNKAIADADLITTLKIKHVPPDPRLN